MAGREPKGKLTALESLFPPEEAEKAVARVGAAIADRRKELDRLRGFISDNTELINLVQRLPDDLSHDIMVPLGKAAFFPGKLIHTNEFLVLLGEGYYAERTAKQTVGILQRRGNSMEAQVESLKAAMLDLEAEARFFKSTSDEAAEGLVEIMEEYIEEPNENESKSDDTKEDNSKLSPDEEYARVMARLDKLEKEELEEEDAYSTDEEPGKSGSSELEDNAFSIDEHESDGAEFGRLTSRHYLDKQESNILGEHKLKKPVQEAKGEDLSFMHIKPVTDVPHLYLEKEQQPPVALESRSRYLAKDDYSKSKTHLVPLDPTENICETLPSDTANYSGFTGNEAPRMGFDGRRAFTGSIIEHDSDLLPKPQTRSFPHQPSVSNPSKPVSRFKMQRGNR